MPHLDLRLPLAITIAIAAAAAPSLLAYNVAPSPTFLNQALALGLWGAFVAATARARPGRGSAPLLAALGLLAAAAAWSWAAGGLPASLTLSAIGMLLAAAVLAAGGAAARAAPEAEDLFAAFCWAWLVAGLLNVGLAIIQVFAPGLADGDWIARSSIAGRAVGNLRQPNHLSSLLLWGCIAAAALADLGRLAQRTAAALLALMVFAVVLTASRTGLVSVLLLALWGLVDARLARPTRALLLTAPLVYAAAWFGMAQWAAAFAHSFGGAARLAETDISGSRFAIWANTVDLIRMQPWAGVGFGEFNFAWTLTPFPGRPVAFFDHTHNLPLQLMVELGLPLAGLVMALLAWALWRAARTASTSTPTPTPGGEPGAAPRRAEVTAQRCALVMVLMIGLHSLLEYPLWYAYFLLPAAWAWGFALGSPGRVSVAFAAPARRPRGLALAGLALVLGAVLSVWDYYRVALIFSAPEGAAVLAQRIADGQRSVLFAHHADYAAVTSGVAMRDPQAAFDRAAHYLLDTRLLMAWARALAAHGELDAARHLAQRLREFHKPEAQEFFEACPAAAAAGSSAAAAAPPLESTQGRSQVDSTSAGGLARSDWPGGAFKCEAPVRAPGWREFLPR